MRTTANDVFMRPPCQGATDDKKAAGKKGGLARGESLSSKARISIAQRAAAARWDKPLKATHKGNFKDEFGFDVECYVLDDAQKTAVISQMGMGDALGLVSTSSDRLRRLLAGRNIAPFVSRELREKVGKPLKFQGVRTIANVPPPIVHGLDVTILIDVCKAVVEAESQGKLLDRQKNVAKQAHVILNASAKAGIKGLVYALAGYDVTRQEVIEAFKHYVREEAKKYEQEFPPELYLEWHRLYQIPVLDRGRSWHFKHLTVRHIYYPLAKSNGKILELLRALKATGGDRQKKLFQFLNEVGARALRMQIGRVLEMTESSPDRPTYEGKIVERFGGQQELDLVTPPQPGLSRQSRFLGFGYGKANNALVKAPKFPMLAAGQRRRIAALSAWRQHDRR
jgi:hypothetical protein